MIPCPGTGILVLAFVLVLVHAFPGTGLCTGTGTCLRSGPERGGSDLGLGLDTCPYLSDYSHYF